MGGEVDFVEGTPANPRRSQQRGQPDCHGHWVNLLRRQDQFDVRIQSTNRNRQSFALTYVRVSGRLPNMSHFKLPFRANWALGGSRSSDMTTTIRGIHVRHLLGPRRIKNGETKASEWTV